MNQLSEGIADFRHVETSWPRAFSSSAGDYDLDGWIDLANGYRNDFAGWIGTNYLVHNVAGEFTVVTNTPFALSRVGIEWSYWVDYDGDGDPDFFGATSVDQRDLLFRNDGNGQFVRVTTNRLSNAITTTVMAGWADYDNDGFLDLLAQRYERGRTSTLYRNNLRQLGNQNHWLKIQLRGIVSNPNGFHANIRVKATIGGESVWQMRTIGVHPFATDLLAHFGLGDAPQIETLRIEWPSGIVQELSNVPVDQAMTVTEARNAPGTPGPPPAIAGFGPAAEGTFQATVTCSELGVRGVLQASSDLVHWAKVMMRTNATGTMEFTDASAASNPARFYRVVVP